MRFVLGIIVDVDAEGETRRLNLPTDSPAPPTLIGTYRAETLIYN